jgi:hypothetical protein
MTHFYYRKYEIKLESVKKPHPSMVIFIGSTKRLNNYNAPMS